jgi:hypothetical protein
MQQLCESCCHAAGMARRLFSAHTLLRHTCKRANLPAAVNGLLLRMPRSALPVPDTHVLEPCCQNVIIMLEMLILLHVAAGAACKVDVLAAPLHLHSLPTCHPSLKCLLPNAIAAGLRLLCWFEAIALCKCMSCR